MKYYLIFISLIALVACASKKTNNNNENKNLGKEIASKILECISASDGISDNLKNFVTEAKNSGEGFPFNFRNIKMGDNDRKIMRECKKEVFAERRKRIKNEENI